MKHIAAIFDSASSRAELTRKAVHSENPGHIPICVAGHLCEQADIAPYNVSLAKGDRDEWGYALKSKTRAAPVMPTRDLDRMPRFKRPALNRESRMSGSAAFRAKAGDRYLLASFRASGMGLYMALRGWENTARDFKTNIDMAEALLDQIIEFENSVIDIAAANCFHGIKMTDIWNTSEGPVLSSEEWREIFKPRYKKQIAHAHTLGLQIWFHCEINPTPIIADLHEIGADVIGFPLPAPADAERIGMRWRGRQCFMAAVRDNRTDPEAARRAASSLGNKAGGMVFSVECSSSKAAKKWVELLKKTGPGV